MTTTKERPILFQGRLVRAILADQKTQTRRVMKPQPSEEWTPGGFGMITRCVNGWPLEPGDPNHDGDEGYACPYGAPGDGLWVRETSRRGPDGYEYRADDRAWIEHYMDGTLDEWRRREQNRAATPWTPSIHMPKDACRLRLRVEDVRVERLRDITTQDCIAEGVECRLPGTEGGAYRAFDGTWHPNAQDAFRWGWDSIHPARIRVRLPDDQYEVQDNPARWDANPWVWAVTFRRRWCATHGRPMPNEADAACAQGKKERAPP